MGKDHDFNFLDYLDGTLSAEQTDSIKVHLETCQQCAEKLDFLRHTYDVIEDRPKLEPNPFLSHKIKTAINEDSRKTTAVEKLSFVLKPIAIAASLLLGVYLGSPEELEVESGDINFALEEDLLIPDYQEALLTLNIE